MICISQAKKTTSKKKITPYLVSHIIV